MEVMDQRRNEIVEFVNENQTVTFTQLKEKFPAQDTELLMRELAESGYSKEELDRIRDLLEKQQQTKEKT